MAANGGWGPEDIPVGYRGISSQQMRNGCGQTNEMAREQFLRLRETIPWSHLHPAVVPVS